MDINLILSLSIILSGVYSFFCFIPATGKNLFPSLYTKDASVAQRYSIFLSGIFGVAVGLYGIFINPLFV
jgi:hypothetical protein